MTSLVLSACAAFVVQVHPSLVILPFPSHLTSAEAFEAQIFNSMSSKSRCAGVRARSPYRTRSCSRSEAQSNSETSSQKKTDCHRKRKECMVTAIDDDYKRRHGKSPICGDNSSPVPMPNAVPLFYNTDVDDSKRPPSILDTHTHSILPWQGGLWCIVPSVEELHTPSTSTPIPVRLSSALILLRLPGEVIYDEEQWVFGLAIHAYVHNSRRELIYVIMLDNGRELYIPCRHVQPLILLNQYDGKDDSMIGTEDSLHAVLEGYASSEEFDYQSHTSAAAANSLFQKTSTLEGTNTEDADEESWHSWYNFSSFPETQSNNDIRGQHAQGTTFSTPSTAALSNSVPTLPDTSLHNYGGRPPSFPSSFQSSGARHFADLFRHVMRDCLGGSNPRQDINGTTNDGGSLQAPVLPRRTLPGEPTVPPTPMHLNTKACMQSAVQSLLAVPITVPHASTSLARDVVTSPTLEGRRTTLISNNDKINNCTNGAAGSLDQHVWPIVEDVQLSGLLPPEAATGRPLLLLNATTKLPVSSVHKIGECSRPKPSCPTNFQQGPKLLATKKRRPVTQPVTVACGPSTTVEQSQGTSRQRRHGQLSTEAVRLQFLAAFVEDTWSMRESSFGEPLPPFTGPRGGPTFPIHRMPTKSALFVRFWSDRTLEQICIDTNKYTSELHPVSHVPLGGRKWWCLETIELKAFFAVNLLMGIKHLPNHWSYWNRGNQFLYCPSISSIMTCRRYEDITRCLHIADDIVEPFPGEHAEFDKLRKMRWLLTEIQQRFQCHWNLFQEVTIDETMIPYKGKYCPVRQYLPRKPTKWGVKVWCLADAKHKYIYDFQVYTGALSGQSQVGGRRGDAKTPHEVVLQLLEGLHGRSHVVCTDNYFTSVKLLVELRSLGTFGVGTVCCNHIALLKCLVDLKSLSKEPQGTLLWRMHRSCAISCVAFVDRKAVLFLSTYYPPIPPPNEVWPTVPRQIRGVLTDLPTSLVHKAYCNFMQGVDVADQLRGSYSCQTRSHKWWHKIFFYLVDTSSVNAYILHKLALEQLGKPPQSHLEFQMQLADELSQPWSFQRGAVSLFRLLLPGVHSLVRSGHHRKCRFCRGRKRTNMLCPQCGGIFLHVEECFQRSHFELRR